MKGILIPYARKRWIIWYKKRLILSIFSFVYLKLNSKVAKDHFKFRSILIEEIVLIHAFGSSSYSTGLNANPVESNMVRIVKWHFVSQLPSPANKTRAWWKCVWYRKMGSCKDTCYWSSKCILTLSLNECFEVCHARTNITKEFGNEFDFEWLHIFRQYLNLWSIREEKNTLHILNFFSSIFSLVCWFFFSPDYVFGF